MSSIKKTLRKIVNKFGLDIHRLPRKDNALFPTKIEDDLGLYKTASGNFYLPMNAFNDGIANTMKAGLVYDSEIVDVAAQFIKNGTAVLDLGANFGQMALMFSQLTGDDGIVYAFEAQKKVFDILEKNVEANNVQNIQPLFNAVYFESDKIFHFPEPDFVKWDAYGSYNLPLDAVSGDEVKSLKIDDLRIEKPISFMKIDVQGCDLFAMQGARETIKKHQMPIIFEFEQQFQPVYKTSFQDYVDFIDSIGYKFAEVIKDINFLILPR